jgi:hypothetical protein
MDSIETKEEWDRLKRLFFQLESIDKESAGGLTAVAIGKGWPYSQSGLGFGGFEEATDDMKETGYAMLQVLEGIPTVHLHIQGSMTHAKRECLRLNIPAKIVEGTDFHEWLDKAAGVDGDVANAATWHRPGPIGEYSDVFVHVCETDGSNSDMPQRWWDAIVRKTGPFYEGLVWISFEE